VTRRLPRALVGYAAVAFALLHLPVIVLAVFSFNRSRYSVAWTGFTLDWYAQLLQSPDVLAALRTSLLVAGISTVIATALGTLYALALTRGRPRGRVAFEALVLLPIVTPEIVVGIASLALFAAAGLALGVATITIAHIAFSVSFVVVVVRARLDGMDRALEEAAMTLGATRAAAFRRVTLPLLWPGIVAGALLAFTMSIDDFVITFFVAGPGSSTLPLLVYSMARRTVDPTVNAISTCIVAVTTVLIFGLDRLTRDGAAPAGAVRG